MWQIKMKWKEPEYFLIVLYNISVYWPSVIEGEVIPVTPFSLCSMLIIPATAVFHFLLDINVFYQK